MQDTPPYIPSIYEDIRLWHNRHRGSSLVKNVSESGVQIMFFTHNNSLDTRHEITDSVDVFSDTDTSSTEALSINRYRILFSLKT